MKTILILSILLNIFMIVLYFYLYKYIKVMLQIFVEKMEQYNCPIDAKTFLNDIMKDLKQRT